MRYLAQQLPVCRGEGALFKKMQKFAADPLLLEAFCYGDAMKHLGRLTHLHLMALCLGVGGTLVAHADTVSVTVPNYSFENPASSSDNITYQHGGNLVGETNGQTSSFIQDWTVRQYNDGENGTINYSADHSITSGGLGSQGAELNDYYGYYLMLLTSGSATNNDGTAAGTSGFVTTVIPLTTYTLTVAVGEPNGHPAPSLSDAPGLVLSLVDADGNNFASNQIAYSSLSQGTLTDETLTFTSSASPGDVGEGLEIQLGLYNGNNNNSVSPLVIDNVRLTESGPNIVAPEPSTWAMLLLGAGGLAFLARRRLAA
jgi:hypothetical protein